MTNVAPPSASARNIRAISDLEHAALAKRSAGERWADRVASAAGKVWFTIGHFVFFVVWLSLNVGSVPGFRAFDPFPFPLLTLVTSLEAIFLSLFILTSQARATAQADQRSHLDLQVNLLAESEATAILRMLRALCEEHGLKIAQDAEVKQLAERIEPKTLLRDLQTQLPDSP